MPWLFLFIANPLILIGVALAYNWRRWADRYAAWNRSTWGRLAGWSASPTWVRALGVFYVLFGIVIDVLYVAFLVSRPAPQ